MPVRQPLDGWESSIKYRRHVLYRDPPPMQWDRRRSAEDEDYEDVGFTKSGRWGNQGSGILFTTGDKILLLHRSPYVEEPGTWGIPGGAVPQRGSSFMDPLRSAEKETREELGSLPQFTVIDEYVYEEPHFRYTTFIAHVNPEDAEELHPKFNWENDDYAWISLDELEDYDLHFGVVELLNHKNPFVRVP